MTFILNDSTEHTVKLRAGDSVLETALKTKIPLDFSCTEGTCGSCRVTVVSAPTDLEPAHEVEIETMSERGFAEEERLACQMKACTNLKVKIPDYR